MRILLVYPEFPDTFWSFKHALKFVRKKASSPPLGLLTVAAMLPPSWHVKLVDLDVTSLTDDDILWSDRVFLGGMIVHAASAREVAARCRSLGRTVIAGGPLFADGPKEFPEIDHEDLFGDGNMPCLVPAERRTTAFPETARRGRRR